MTCGGCAGQVERVLGKLGGIFFFSSIFWHCKNTKQYSVFRQSQDHRDERWSEVRESSFVVVQAGGAGTVAEDRKGLQPSGLRWLFYDTFYRFYRFYTFYENVTPKWYLFDDDYFIQTWVWLCSLGLNFCKLDDCAIHVCVLSSHVIDWQNWFHKMVKFGHCAVHWFSFFSWNKEVSIALGVAWYTGICHSSILSDSILSNQTFRGLVIVKSDKKLWIC